MGESAVMPEKMPTYHVVVAVRSSSIFLHEYKLGQLFYASTPSTTVDYRS